MQAMRHPAFIVVGELKGDKFVVKMRSNDGSEADANIFSFPVA